MQLEPSKALTNAFLDSINTLEFVKNLNVDLSVATAYFAYDLKNVVRNTATVRTRKFEFAPIDVQGQQICALNFLHTSLFDIPTDPNHDQYGVIFPESPDDLYDPSTDFAISIEFIKTDGTVIKSPIADFLVESEDYQVASVQDFLKTLLPYSTLYYLIEEYKYNSDLLKVFHN